MYVWTPDDENQACEIVPGKVRGRIEYGGYIITPLTMNSCHVDYTVCVYYFVFNNNYYIDEFRWIDSYFHS